MLVDFRSDTVTRPTAGMRAAMMSAPVGDDVFGEDESVNALERYAADLFGMGAALFCPSGTMTNQIALNLLTKPRDQVICDQYSHVYLYEGGGLASNSQVTARLIKGDRGRITAAQVEAEINPADIHFPASTVVSLENTMNKGGGCIYDFDEIRKISNLCTEKGLSLHLDGARLFNALVETEQTAKDFGAHFDTISICLSKGLGAPVGSLLLMKDQGIRFEAMRTRKVFGGGMRQAGFLAAAGQYALENHVDRLKEDHAKCQILASQLAGCSWVNNILPVETNILIFEHNLDQQKLIEKFKSNDVLVVGMGAGKVRFVTHLDINDDMINQACQVIKEM